MMRRSSKAMKREGSNRFMMRPSIARMTLDLDYGDMGMENIEDSKRGEKRAEVLSHRLAELLVFEIRQDGETQYKNLSVRGLYKYVMQSIKISAEKRRAIRNMEDTTLQFIQHRRETTSKKKQRLLMEYHRGNNNRIDEDFDSSSSTSNDDKNDDHDNDSNNKHRDLLGQRPSATKSSNNGSSEHSVEGKTVSFGGPRGPIVTEHPPKIPGVPIAQEAEHRMSLASGGEGSGGGCAAAIGTSPIEEPADELTAEPASTPYHSAHHITYRERLGGFLHPRDMRRLVTPFSASNEPELIVRRHVILLNFDPLRAVILRDRLLVLVPDGADSILVDLERRVRGGSKEIERAIFGESVFTQVESSNLGDSQHSASNLSELGKGISSAKRKSQANSLLDKVKNTMNPHEAKNTFEDKTISFASSDNESTGNTHTDAGSEFQEWEEMESRDWIDLPFELQCLDAVLGSVCHILGKDAGELRSNSIHAMENIINHGAGQGDEVLRHIKNSIKEMTSRVKGFTRAMNLVLDETEDMALMNLTRLLTHPERFIQPVPEEILNEESDEPELILEAHLQTAFSLTNSLDLVRGEIETTQELINQRLDAVRNRLLYANMVISIGSFGIAFGSFIGSMYGMNVPNILQEDPGAFNRIVGGTVVGMLGLVMMSGLGLWYVGTLGTSREPTRILGPGYKDF